MNDWEGKLTCTPEGLDALARMAHPQNVVAQNVIDRGYAKGFTDTQMIARQVAKLVEEVDESACYIVDESGRVSDWSIELSASSSWAREHFDHSDWWDGVSIINPVALAEELADIQVVLFTAAHFLGVDIVQMALDKSNADVARGVR